MSQRKKHEALIIVKSELRRPSPLAKHPIPLGREIRYAQMMPRVYAVTMWMLRRVAKSIVGPSNLCYSNISSDPWHEGYWIMVDG